MKLFLLTVSALGALGLLPREPRIEDRPTREHGLEWQVGTWKGTRRAADDGSENPLTLHVRSILDGAGLTYELTIPHDGGVYRGFSVQVHEPEEKLWRRRYVNDVRRTFADLEGRPEAENLGADRMVWRSVTAGRTREHRLVSEHPSEHRWVRTMNISDDEGESWQELWIDTLQREAD